MDIYLEGGQISCVGECAEKSGIVLDAHSMICMPALYNAHTHAAMVLFRGFHDDAKLEEWLERVWRAEKRLTPGIVADASKLAVMEMLSTGTAGFVDMYFYPEETARVAEEMGIRALVGPVMLENMTSIEKWVSETLRLAKNLEKGRLVRLVVNVHSLYAAPIEAVEAGLEIAAKTGARLQMHAAETRREVYAVKKRYGKFPVEALRDAGLLTGKLHLVHMGWATSWEYRAVAEAGATVAHCPVSNMKLATAGFLPLHDLQGEGITVGLGTDGAASNNVLDMFREMKAAVLLQRHSYWDTRVKALHALRAATLGGAEIMGLRAGRLKPGYEADLVLLDASSLHLQPLRADNLVSALVYAATGSDVAYTIVAGRIAYSPEKASRFSREARRIAERLNSFFKEETMVRGRGASPSGLVSR